MPVESKISTKTSHYQLLLLIALHLLFHLILKQPHELGAYANNNTS